MIVQVTEWQSPTGKWYSNYTGSFSPDISNSVLLARAIGLSWQDFITWLIENFKPDFLEAYIDKELLIFSWNNYYDMHKFTLAYNKLAREKNIIFNLGK